jgi:hypothetical protein
VIVPVGVVRDDPGHQCLEGRVPAVLGRVQGAVALHHPAQIAGRGRPEQERNGAGSRLDDLLDAGHGPGQALPVRRAERGEQGTDLIA